MASGGTADGWLKSIEAEMALLRLEGPCGGNTEVSNELAGVTLRPGRLPKAGDERKGSASSWWYDGT